MTRYSVLYIHNGILDTVVNLSLLTKVMLGDFWTRGLGWYNDININIIAIVQFPFSAALVKTDVSRWQLQQQRKGFAWAEITKQELGTMKPTLRIPARLDLLTLSCPHIPRSSSQKFFPYHSAPTNDLTCYFFDKVFTFDCEILDTLTFHFHNILQSMSLSFQRPRSHLSPSLVQPPLWAQEHALHGALTSFLYSMWILSLESKPLLL